MSRWIDAEWLTKYFKRGKEYKGEYVLDGLKYEAPSIDIVRCKECKYWKDFECQCDWASTDHEGGASYSLDRDADDFCSYGEREGE